MEIDVSKYCYFGYFCLDYYFFKDENYEFRFFRRSENA